MRGLEMDASAGRIFGLKRKMLVSYTCGSDNGKGFHGFRELTILKDVYGLIKGFGDECVVVDILLMQ